MLEFFISCEDVKNSRLSYKVLVLRPMEKRNKMALHYIRERCDRPHVSCCRNLLLSNVRLIFLSHNFDLNYLAS
jgi:hypothetical protein